MTGRILNEFVLYGVHNWTGFHLHAIADGWITVEFGSTGSDIWGPAAYHIDALVLTPEPTGLVLFSLAGLALFRRRRHRKRAYPSGSRFPD